MSYRWNTDETSWLASNVKALLFTIFEYRILRPDRWHDKVVMSDRVYKVFYRATYNRMSNIPLMILPMFVWKQESHLLPINLAFWCCLTSLILLITGLSAIVNTQSSLENVHECSTGVCYLILCVYCSILLSVISWLQMRKIRFWFRAFVTTFSLHFDIFSVSTAFCYFFSPYFFTSIFASFIKFLFLLHYSLPAFSPSLYSFQLIVFFC